MNIKNTLFSIILIAIFSIASLQAFSQKDNRIDSSLYQIETIAFYNLENLFDTIDDPDVRDEENTPKGDNLWDTKRYNEKLNHMAKTISLIGSDYIKGGPMILGIAEIENKGVTEDLINTKYLKNSNYGIVHYEGPYARGVDVALIYRKDFFEVTNSRAVETILPYDYKTRDILVVSGLLEGEPIHILVNHWPSRGGGKRSVGGRKVAALQARALVDSIVKIEPNAKVIVMGDLNDDPDSESIAIHLNAGGKISKLKEGQMFSTMAPLLRKGIGSLAYRDSWNLFDQIIITQSLLGDDYSSFKFHSASVFNKNFLITKSGKFAGYPFRTFSYGAYIGGYSDHLPTFIYLIRDLKK